MAKLNRPSNYLCIALTLMLLSGEANADFYSCKDSSGHVVTSDRPIPECADKSTQVYKDSGILKKELAGAITPEQKRAAELQEQKRAQDAAHQEQLKRETQFLVAHFPNEADIESARRKELDALETKISNETKSIAAANEAINQNQKRMAFLAKNQPVQAKQAQMKIDDLTQSIQESTTLIRNYRLEEVNVNRQYDETHKRYLEIVPAKSH